MELRARAILVLVAAVVLALSLEACSGTTSETAKPVVLQSEALPTPTADEVRVVAAGDVECEPGGAVTPVTCQSASTAKLIKALAPAYVLGLGDLQYETGAPAAFNSAFDKTWGQFRRIIKPVPGNHEYGTPAAAGYAAYFSDAAPEYYAWNLAGWRFYMLDSECDQIDCTAEATWLDADLSAHPTKCSAIAMHYPRFSSGPHHSQASVEPLWQVAAAHHVDLALAGHDHDYERFAPLSPDGIADDVNGIREFVVGTGGKSLYAEHAVVSGSQAFLNGHFGVLALGLRPTGYSWNFVDTSGTSQDSGSATCH